MPKNKQQESLKNKSTSDKQGAGDKSQAKGAKAPPSGQSQTQAKR